MHVINYHVIFNPHPDRQEATGLGMRPRSRSVILVKSEYTNDVSFCNVMGAHPLLESIIQGTGTNQNSESWQPLQDWRKVSMSINYRHSNYICLILTIKNVSIYKTSSPFKFHRPPPLISSSTHFPFFHSL